MRGIKSRLLVLGGVFWTVILLIAGCSSPNRQAHFSIPISQFEMRNMQTRSFDEVDRALLIKSVIAVLQDFGFILDHSDRELGFVSASKAAQTRSQPMADVNRLDSVSSKHGNVPMRAMVMVTSHPNGSNDVRCVIQVNQSPVLAMGLYQEFFAAVENAVFIEKNL